MSYEILFALFALTPALAIVTFAVIDIVETFKKERK